MQSPAKPGSDVAVKKPVSFVSVGVGAIMQMWEVSTLGQPFEVIKTTMAAHRHLNLRQAIVHTYNRGGLLGFYQGLIPWAWIEAISKGAVLLYSSSEVEYYSQRAGASKTMAGLLGGMFGGVAQAYTTMGFCTFMKTVEVTRSKALAGSANVSTWSIAYGVWQREGFRGLNKGVSAVALRQMTNWGSRFGISRFTENLLKGSDKNKQLSKTERLIASIIGGALSCWNQPIEVIRVEMQSWAKGQKAKPLGLIGTAKYIYEKNGLLGFYRGVTPRIGLGAYLTVCMVFGGDELKEYANKKFEKKS